MSWTNSRGSSGTCSGTTTWSNSGIALSSGENIISVTAKDAVGNTATATLTVTYTPPDTAPEIVEEDSYPHDAQGMDDGTLRVPIDTSIVTRIKSDGGIDEDSVEMSIENQSAGMLIEKQSVNIRVQEVNEGDDTDFWIIHSPNTPFAFEQAVNFTVDAKNLNGVEMVTYYSSFKIESEEEHAAALADTPPSTEYADDPVIGQNTIAADPGTAIEGAKIIYGNLEPVTAAIRTSGGDSQSRYCRGCWITAEFAAGECVREAGDRFHPLSGRDGSWDTRNLCVQSCHRMAGFLGNRWLYCAGVEGEPWTQ